MSRVDKKQLVLTYEIELNDDQLPTRISVSFQSPVKGVKADGEIEKVDRLRFQSDYVLSNFGKVDPPEVPKEITKLLK